MSSKPYPPDDEDSTAYPPPSLNTDGPILPGPSTGWRQHPLTNTNRRHSSFFKLFAFVRSSRPLTRYLLIFAFILLPVYWLSIFAGIISPPARFDLYRPSRPPPPPGPPPVHPDKQKLWTARAEQVKTAYLFALKGYEQLAFPADELLPIKGGRVNNFNGWAVTMVDSMDTMLMMGLYDEFDKGVNVVQMLDFKNHASPVPFFETTIRYFGGLLAAYSLSLDLPSSSTFTTQERSTILLSKVDELATALLPAFNTASGLPWSVITPTTGEGNSNWGANVTILAEAGSCQLEYKFLAHLTGKKEYFEKADKVVDSFQKYQDRKTDLLSILWSLETGAPLDNHFSIGALADSAYEYLLKGYILSGYSETRLLKMYLRATKGIINNLLYISPRRNLLYVTDIQNGVPSHTLEELSCFLPGLFALGAHLLPVDNHFTKKDRQLHLWVAEGLSTTCYTIFADSFSGLAPDEVQFAPPLGEDGKHDASVSIGKKWKDVYAAWEKTRRDEGENAFPPGVREPIELKKHAKDRDYMHKRLDYLLRPETVESMFLMWRVTGDEKWRTRAWEIFLSIEKHSKTKFGYASLSFVDTDNPPQKEEMPSYFLAETLKYLWLLFSEGDGGIPLDKYIFNTEAHPLPVFDWSSAEKGAYRIS